MTSPVANSTPVVTLDVKRGRAANLALYLESRWSGTRVFANRLQRPCAKENHPVPAKECGHIDGFAACSIDQDNA